MSFIRLIIGAEQLVVAIACGWLMPTACAVAGPVIVGIPLQNDDGVTTDLFDVAQGAIVTGSSPLYPGFNAEGAFGATSPQAIEGFRTIFADAQISTDFIEFSTPHLIDLSSYRLVLGEDGDGSGNRSASAFRLYASDSPADVLSHLVSSTSIAHTYTANYGSPQIAISDSLNALDVQYFRMEIDRTSNGPRVFELDGFGVVVPEPSSIAILTIASLITGAWSLHRRRAHSLK